MNLLPCFIRLRDAPPYLGMDRNRFNIEVRPYITEIPIGAQGIAFDRLEIDAWADQYKVCNGRPGKQPGGYLWDVKERRGSLSAVGSGISTRGSGASDFAKALERATSEKRRRTSCKGSRHSGGLSSTENARGGRSAGSNEVPE